MTDVRMGMVVVLDDDVREEDAVAIAATIRMIRGVAAVQRVDTEPEVQLVREQVNAEWRERIVGLLDDEGV
jgi:cell division protein FtsX